MKNIINNTGKKIKEVISKIIKDIFNGDRFNPHIGLTVFSGIIR